MQVAIVNYAYDALLQTPAALLQAYGALTGWAAGLAQAGAQVTVFQRYRHDATIKTDDAISYQFVADRWRPLLRRWQIPQRLHRLIRETAPDVVHINGLGFALQARLLRAALPARTAMLAQHRADRPAQGYSKYIQRQGLSVLDGCIFSARAQATAWIQAGLIRTGQPIVEIIGGSTGFHMTGRATARRRTGMYGDPVVLWVGRLDRNKDPLTVLQGLEQVIPAHPGIQLYMAYSSTALLGEVQDCIAARPALAQAVTLLGQIPNQSLESYYNSADYFVLGSHDESSGFALVEAMACGVVPIVTDIPSFRRITGDGTIGALWSSGDAAGFAQALLAVLRTSHDAQAQTTRQFFDDHLSWPALGRQALGAYGVVIRQRAAQGRP